MLSEQADTKGCNLHNSTYLAFGKGKNRETKLDQWLPGARSQKRVLTTNNQEGTLRKMETSYMLIIVVIICLKIFVKTHQKG